MKKVFRLFLSAILLGMAACGGGGGATETGSSSSSSSSTSSSSSSITTYTVGGTVSGFASATALVLFDDGGDPLTINTNGAFTFGTALASGPYSVTIGTQPTGQTCSVTNGAGVINTINVVNVAVNCTTNTFTVSGTVTGNIGSVTLLNNLGDAKSVTGNGGFTFTAQNYGTTYSVTVGTQPTGETCLVSNGSGTIAGAVTNVTVSCNINTFTVGGTVTGNAGSVTVLNNSGDPQSVTGDGGFTFAAQNFGTTYAVTVGTQPAGQACSVNNGSGTISNVNVINVNVACLVTPPAVPTPVVTYNNNPNQVILNWAPVSGATYYTISKDPTGSAGYSPICQTNSLTATSCIDGFTKLTDFIMASYRVSACNAVGCTDSAAIAAFTTQAIQYIKASNTNANDSFGNSVALSADGSTLAVGAWGEASATTGINGNQADNSAPGAGAVYVFTRSGTSWSQQAYIKASNTNANDDFGWSVALSADGNTLAVGATNQSYAGAVYVFTRSSTSWSQQAYIKASNADLGDAFGVRVALSGDGSMLAVGAMGEASAAIGINGNQSDNSASGAGAVYIFTRSGSTWSQQAYIKASNTNANDYFGSAVVLSGDGSTLAVGAYYEASAAIGINGNQSDNSASGAGAVYIFTRSSSTWNQQAYIKASNNGTIHPFFGSSVALSADGNTLAVGASDEDSAATGINGNQTDTSANGAGAVYVFTRSGSTWSQQAYIKASNTNAYDTFGWSVALSADGSTLAIGAAGESSAATGINGNQADNSAQFAGAVYVFTRSGSTWSQQAYIKASNTNSFDQFGQNVALSADGNTLAVGASDEDSSATGINGNQLDNSVGSAGAVYVY